MPQVQNMLVNKYARGLNMVRFYMQGLLKDLNMAQYATIMPDYASICLNAPQYA